MSTPGYSYAERQMSGDFLNTNTWQSEGNQSAAGFGFALQPDATDKAVKARRMNAALMMLSGRGESQSLQGMGYADTGSMLGGF